MLISAAPVAIPVTTANLPTESVASEAAQKVPVPKTTPPTESPNPRNTTENHEQTKNPLDFSQFVREEGVREKSEQQQNNQQQNSQQQSGKQNQQETENATSANSSVETKTQSSDPDQQQRERIEAAEQAKLARQVAELKATDRAVRAHETAHAAAGGSLTGAPQLSFTIGPDGKRYATSGEVSIDTSKVPGDPARTIDKMQRVRAAALAPANPSPQDLKVAAIASQVANQAQIEINVERSQLAKSQSTSQSTNSSQQTKLSDQDSENIPETRAYRFTNPVSARRSSLHLHQKLVDYGALDTTDNHSHISLTA